MTTKAEKSALQRGQANYRRLAANSRAAMTAAIEIYNKPSFAYRDECFVILALNAWELLLKALLTKNRDRIFDPWRRGKTRRSLKLPEALRRSQKLWPPVIPYLPASENILLLELYRNNAIHLYNKPGFRVIVYALAQTSIVNYRDLLMTTLGVDLASSITIEILPLGLRPPIDPIEYLRQARQAPHARKSTITTFLRELTKALTNVEKAGADAGRLMTVYKTKFESVKKISTAELIVGVTSPSPESVAVVVEKPIDPNVNHPLRTIDVLKALGSMEIQHLPKHPLYSATSFKPKFVIQGVVWKYSVYQNIRYCWREEKGAVTKYSWDFVNFVKTLSPADLQTAMASYREFTRERSRLRRVGV